MTAGVSGCIGPLVSFERCSARCLLSSSVQLGIRSVNNPFIHIKVSVDKKNIYSISPQLSIIHHYILNRLC